MKSWKPDLIYASAPPPSGLWAAARLSRRSGVPWVAEERDLWVDPARYPYPRFRFRLEKRLERSLLGSAAAIVTASEPWAAEMCSRYRCPVTFVTNGYDPDDFPASAELSRPDPAVLRIVYPGVVYPEFQDPTPLFDAIARLGADGSRVKVVFYARYMDAVLRMAERFGVAQQVEGPGRVPHREALKAVLEGDISLLLVWSDPNSPDNQGVIPAKLFEYLGARRQILAVGFGNDVASQMVRERGAGLVSNDPAEIAAWLRAQLESKARGGHLPDLPAAVAAGLSRDEQFANLERFLLDLPLKRSK